jgi:hypothetical protein
MIKSCTKCKAFKPLSEFRKDIRYKLGVISRCKKCCSRGSRFEDPPLGASEDDRHDIKQIIDASHNLAIRINECLRDKAKTPEARRNYSRAVNNLQMGAAA